MIISSTSATEDLSVYDGPITDLFAAPGDAYCVTAEDRDFFETNGYLAGKKLLSDVQLDALREELARLMSDELVGDARFYEYHRNESRHPSKVLFHALGAWRLSEAFHDLLFSPALVAAARALLDGPVRFWHDQLFVKPPRLGGVVAWHQDYSYWTRTKPVGHLTCWIGLDDATTANGCLYYVPGSHKWRLLPKGELADEMDAVLDVLDDSERKGFQPVPIELAAGEATFHHSLLLHGSYENRSEGARRGVVINVFRDGVVSDTDEPLLSGIPAIPRGMKIEGRFFPLLG